MLLLAFDQFLFLLMSVVLFRYSSEGFVKETLLSLVELLQVCTSVLPCLFVPADSSSVLRGL